jgi:hypothetical protein
MWGYRDSLLGKAWCVVQQTLVHKLLQLQLGQFSSTILYMWLSRNAPLTISYIINALEGHSGTKG